MQKTAEGVELVCSEGRRFRLVGLLGRGGFGEVYLAEMESRGGLPLTVALKLLLPGLDPGSQAVERLRDEARVLALLHHSAILKVHDLVIIGNRVGLVMEYVPGMDLHRLIRGEGRMPPRSLVEVLEQVADALDAAYSATSRQRPLHIVHRDVKPGNIRVTPRGEVKLLDFGIAKAQLEVSEAHTVTGHIVGSVPYMAPERFRPGAPSAGPAGDVYALGCILVEGLVGRPLMKGLSWQKVAGMSFQSEAFEAHLELFLEEGPDLPDDLVRLALAMLEPRPERRPTARQVVEQLEGIRRALPGQGLRRWARERGEIGVVELAEVPSVEVMTLSGSVSQPVTQGPRTAWERRPVFGSEEEEPPPEEELPLEPVTEPSLLTPRVRHRARMAAWTFGGAASVVILGVAFALVLVSATLYDPLRQDPPPGLPDQDADGVPEDQDADFIPDAIDACPGRGAVFGYDLDLDGCTDDADGDGVPDPMDRCAAAAFSGTDLDSDGCSDDRDEDGVLDHEDACPAEGRPRGSDADGDGCANDADGDGYPDAFDRCPQLAGVAPDGCPAPVPVDGSPTRGGSVAPSPPPSLPADTEMEDEPEEVQLVEVLLLSDPRTMVLMVDGETAGRTPRKLTLEPGGHRVEVQSGERSATFQVEVEPDGRNRWCLSIDHAEPLGEDCQPPAVSGPPAFVTQGEFADWLEDHPEWTRTGALEAGRAERWYLQSWVDGKPNDRSALLSGITAPAGQAFCRHRGGLLTEDEEPRKWEGLHLEIRASAGGGWIALEGAGTAIPIAATQVVAFTHLRCAR